MGAAISLFVILTISVVVVRIAAVALRLTGVPANVARFQARSAFTGSGFTTSESESIVNHPIRRRLIGLLMLYGNIGLVTVMATFIVSFVATGNSMVAVSQQLVWLLAALGLLWLLALNPYADRVMCKSIGWLLHRMTPLGQPGPKELLQIGGKYSVVEYAVLSNNKLNNSTISDMRVEQSAILILGITHVDGSYSSAPEPQTQLVAGDRVAVYGSKDEHCLLDSESIA